MKLYTQIVADKGQLVFVTIKCVALSVWECVVSLRNNIIPRTFSVIMRGVIKEQHYTAHLRCEYVWCYLGAKSHRAHSVQVCAVASGQCHTAHTQCEYAWWYPGTILHRAHSVRVCAVLSQDNIIPRTFGASMRGVFAEQYHTAQIRCEYARCYPRTTSYLAHSV